MQESRFRRMLFGDGAATERRRRWRATPPPGATVLVVDDSRTVLHTLRKMLNQGGYRVIEARDAETGLALAREQRPDLIFMDVVLPGINGFEATRALRRDSLIADIPVVIMSGNAAATEQYWVLRIGARGFMVKPFTRGSLYEHVNRLFSESRRSRPDRSVARTADVPAG